MAKYLPLPDGTSVTIREGETPQDAWARAQRMYPEAFQSAAPASTAESGFTPALKSGYSELKSGIAALAGRSGVMDPEAAQKYIAEQEEYQKRTFKPTATFGEAPITKTLELLGGSLPYTAAPLAVGALAPFAPVLAGGAALTGTAATIAGLGAAGAASATQFTGSNLRRQMEEGKALGETELAPAFAAALPQAALDMVSFRMIPGIRQLFTTAGKEIAPAAAKRIAEQGVKEIAKDYTLATGRAMTAEGLTEAGQQVLERMQAGLSLTDEKARGEYLDSLIGGAVLGGALSPAGRYVERRGEAAKQEAERLQKAQEVRAQEEARRASPEGQAAFVQDYDARSARLTELKAVPKPGKDATPLERAEYAEVKKERAKLEAQLTRDASAYKTAKAAVQQAMRTDPEAAAKLAEIEGTATADAQTQPYFVEPQGTLPGMEAVPSAAAPAPEAEFVDYAAQIRNLEGRLDDLRTQAQSTTSLDEKLALNQQYEKIKAALRDAELAKKEQDKAAAGPEGKIAALRKRMVKAEEDGDITAQARIATQLKELGVTDLSEVAAPEQGTIPLAPFKTKVEDRAAYAARVFQPGAADIEAQEQEALVEAERQREEAIKEAERERKIAPEVVALRRIKEAQRPVFAEGVQRQGQVSGMVDKIVDAALRTDGKAPGRVISGVAPTDVSKADALRGQLALARATDNRPRAQEIIEQLKAIGESEADTGGDIEAGQTVKKAGVEGRLSAQAIMDNRVTRMSQSQMAAFNKLADYVQTVREGDQNVAEAKKQTLRDAAERLKDTIVGLALNEMDARRAQAGLPELSTEKKLLAVSRLNGVLNELVNRGAGLFNMQETPAVTRGTLTLKSAEQRQPPTGQRMFNNFTAAANSLRAQMRNVIDEVGEIKAPEPRKAPSLKPRVSNELRMMFQGQERPVDEQFDAAFDRAKSDEDYRTLKEIQRVYGKLSDAAREEAVAQVRRVETGQPLEVRGALKDELADLARAGQSDQGQAEMFTGEDERSVSRATTANFMRFLNSAEVKKRRMQIDEARKQAEFQAKRAATIQKKIDEEEKKQQDMLDKLEIAKNKSPVEAARERLASVTDKNKEAVALAKQINSQRTVIRIRMASMVRQISDALDKAKKKEAEIEDLVGYIFKEATLDPNNAEYQKRLGEFLDQQTAATKAVASVEKALEKARATQTRVIEDHAKDTIDNALISEGAKAQRKIDKAEQELKAAQEEEAGAQRRLDAVRQDIKPPRPQTPAEKLAELPVEGVTRVYRDTSAPEVRAKVAALRKTIGKAEEAHAKAMESGDEKAMEESIKAIESAYDKMYEILANAPVRREAQMSAEEARAFEEYEAAQRATVEKTIKLFQEKAGIPPLKLTERRTVASVKNVKTGRVETQIKKESVAQQEKRVKEEAVTGKYPARALEELAKARAELKTVQDQIAYIDANPAAPRSEAKARQTAARTAAVAKRKALEAKVANLAKAQKEVVAEARVEKEAEKALKKERRRMLREDEYEFSRGAATEGQTVAQLEKALDRAIGEKGLAARRIKLFSSVADFFASKEAYDYEGADIPSDAKAFVNPKNGDVFMFANNIAADESVGVLLHEVGVHIGFRKLFSAAKFNALVQSVKNWAAQKDGSLESKIAQRALARVKAAETSAEQFDEELLAYAVEEAVKAGVSPSALKNGSPIQNWLQLVLAALRNALTAFGINPNKLTSGDLVNMAYGAAQLEIRGTWHGSDAKFTAFDSKKAGAGEGAFDRRFDGTNNLGPGPYTTPQQEYAEYYQYAVPFGKAANATGYGDRSYQDYRALDERFMGANNAELTPDELQAKFESRLLNAYLRGVNAGESLNPTQNTSAQKLLEKLTASVRTPAEQAAVATLSLNNLRGLSERPPMGTLYRALDDMPRSQIYEVNAMHTVGDRPEIDALLKKYGNEYDVAQAKDEGRYAGNSLFFKMRRELGVDKTLQLLKKAGINAIEQNAERRYVERAYIGQAPEIIPLTETPVGLSKAEGRPGTGTLLFSKARYANPEMERFGQDTDRVVAKQRGTWEKVKANTTGLAFATQLVDRFAGFERLAKYMDSLKGSQMLYYLRMYDQRMNFVSQAVGNGAPQIVEKTRADGRKEYVIEAKDGANIKNVVQILSKAQPMVGNAEAVNRAFTMYLAALRAQRVGLAALNFGGDVTQDMLDNAINLVERTPGLKEIFDNARNEYNAYNRDLMKFLASTGAISEELANRLAATNDYIPFYREQNGNAMLIIGGENPIRIGNIAEQPYLQELVGGDTAILDFMTSSVQNTNMLMDMGLRNLSTKNAVFELVNLNAAKIVKKADGPDVVRFKVDGEDRYAVLDTETVTIGGERFSTGVPAELLVKGMEGIPTQMPALMRLMAVPAQLLRKAVTLSPMYMAKQLFRDSLAAPIVSGANFTPVFGAIRQINGAAGKTLEERGITGGQYMSGTSEDITKILRDIATGKPGFMTAIGKLEALGMKADSLTRRAQYNSYIAQGMSEMEATLMALESMNFNKRGASPSVHMANSLIPFFNAQIQGLNVLYKAFTGQMPFNDKLKVQQKLLMRGAMIAAVSLIYAAMMEDDEAYKNATPDQKYGNWFVRIPGFDEPVRLPVPFEIGYIFKGIPEALYNTMTTENGGEEAVKAFRQILLQTIPGGSSYGIPQALKPAIEAGLGKSFYTGRDILSAREKELLPEEQFRANTAEVSKALGKEAGISPIVFENLVRGYTGTLGLAFLHTLSLGAPKSESPEAAVKRLSEYPLVGGSFQPNDAGGITNAVYERFNEDIKVRNSFQKMLGEGRTAEANELLQRRGNEIMEAEIGDVFKTNMTKLTQAERAIAASNLSPEEKRAKLDEIRRIKTGLAQTLREAADRTRPQ
jgi:hypothetical protein